MWGFDEDPRALDGNDDIFIKFVIFVAYLNSF